MSPEQALEFSIQFASRLSPLWLLLLLPAAMAAAWWLYQREIAAMDAPRRRTLYGLRMALVGLVCLGVFMPELVVVERLIYPGRVVLLVDDSESMLAYDSAMEPVDAVELARGLGLIEDEDAHVTYRQVAVHLQGMNRALMALQRDLLRRGRQDPAVARQAQQILDRNTLVFPQLLQMQEQAATLVLDEQALEQDVRLWEMIARLQVQMQDMLIGDPPSPQTVDRMIEQFDDAISLARQMQKHVDQGRLSGEASDTALLAATAEVMSSTRLDLLTRMLNAMLQEASGDIAGQYVQLTSIMGDQAALVTPGQDLDPLAARRGRTDIQRRLGQILKEPGDFPLSAVVVFSDGVDLSDLERADTLAMAVQQRVPLYGVGVGSTLEPLDLAIERVTAPPLAVVGQPLTVAVHLKARVPLPAQVQLVLLSEGRELLTQDVLVRQVRQVAYMTTTPTALGLAPYAVQLRTTGPDQFKERNNLADFVVDVREQPVRVLLLDDRPYWQTRFVLNILSRLAYVDLNRIIAITTSQGTLRRGVDRGMWPDTQEGLNIYDMIVLGRFDQALLTPEEWLQVQQFLQAPGKAVALLTSDQAMANLPAALEPWMPLAPEAPALAEAPLSEDASDYRVTDLGALHPLARALTRAFPVAPYPGDHLRPEGFMLVYDETGLGPILSARFAQRGRVFMLSDEKLWKWLNQRNLPGHTAILVNLVDWALRSFEDGVAVDQNVLVEGQGFLVWFDQPGAQAMVSDAQGQQVARVQAQASSSASDLAVAAMQGLAPGRYTLRTSVNDRVHPLFVTVDNEELIGLALDETYLQRLAQFSGGAYRPLAHWRDFFASIPLKERVETHRHVVRFWSSRTVLLMLLLILSIEWIMRKRWRLV